MIVCFSIFSAELIVATWSKTTFEFGFVETKLPFTKPPIEIVSPAITWKGYFGCFMWFLDIAVIVSLLPDIPFMMSATASINVIVLARFVRMFRLIRILKVYYLLRDRSQTNKRRLELMNDSIKYGNSNLLEDLKRIEKSQRPGKLAELLCDSITTRVVLVIVIFLVISPLLTFRPSNEVFSFSTALLQNINEQNSLPSFIKTACVNALMTSLNDQNIPNIYLEMTPYKSGPIVNNINQLNNLPNMAIISESANYYNTTRHVNYYTLADYSNDYFLQIISRHLIAMMILVCFVTILAIIVINYDTSNLVLKPIAVSFFLHHPIILILKFLLQTYKLAIQY